MEKQPTPENRWGWLANSMWKYLQVPVAPVVEYLQPPATNLYSGIQNKVGSAYTMLSPWAVDAYTLTKFIAPYATPYLSPYASGKNALKGGLGLLTAALAADYFDSTPHQSMPYTTAVGKTLYVGLKLTAVSLGMAKIIKALESFGYGKAATEKDLSWSESFLEIAWENIISPIMLSQITSGLMEAAQSRQAQVNGNGGDEHDAESTLNSIITFDSDSKYPNDIPQKISPQDLITKYSTNEKLTYIVTELSKDHPVGLTILHGDPGNGKSTKVKHIARSLGKNLHYIRNTTNTFVGKYVGAAKRAKEALIQKIDTMQKCDFLFLDEVDNLLRNDDSSGSDNINNLTEARKNFLEIIDYCHEKGITPIMASNIDSIADMDMTIVDRKDRPLYKGRVINMENPTFEERIRATEAAFIKYTEEKHPQFKKFRNTPAAASVILTCAQTTDHFNYTNVDKVVGSILKKHEELGLTELNPDDMKSSALIANALAEDVDDYLNRARGSLRSSRNHRFKFEKASGKDDEILRELDNEVRNKEQTVKDLEKISRKLREQSEASLENLLLSIRMNLEELPKITNDIMKQACKEQILQALGFCKEMSTKKIADELKKIEEELYQKSSKRDEKTTHAQTIKALNALMEQAREKAIDELKKNALKQNPEGLYTTKNRLDQGDVTCMKKLYYYHTMHQKLGKQSWFDKQELLPAAHSMCCRLLKDLKGPSLKGLLKLENQQIKEILGNKDDKLDGKLSYTAQFFANYGKEKEKISGIENAEDLMMKPIKDFLSAAHIWFLRFPFTNALDREQFDVKASDLLQNLENQKEDVGRLTKQKREAETRRQRVQESTKVIDAIQQNITNDAAAEAVKQISELTRTLQDQKVIKPLPEIKPWNKPKATHFQTACAWGWSATTTAFSLVSTPLSWLYNWSYPRNTGWLGMPFNIAFWASSKVVQVAGFVPVRIYKTFFDQQTDVFKIFTQDLPLGYEKIARDAIGTVPIFNGDLQKNVWARFAADHKISHQIAIQDTGVTIPENVHIQKVDGEWILQQPHDQVVPLVKVLNNTHLPALGLALHHRCIDKLITYPGAFRYKEHVEEYNLSRINRSRLAIKV